MLLELTENLISGSTLDSKVFFPKTGEKCSDGWLNYFYSWTNKMGGGGEGWVVKIILKYTVP